jgi:hypothetical protein
MVNNSQFYVIRNSVLVFDRVLTSRCPVPVELSAHSDIKIFLELRKVQYNETKVLHFLFSVLRIKGLYMFRALLAHPQDALHKRLLIYCVRVMSVGCNILV